MSDHEQASPLNPESSHEAKHCRQRGDNDWWEDRSPGQKVGLGILFGIGGLAFAAGLVWVTMLLWNWLMPEIFGLKTIDYWQTLGLLVLSCIFFKPMSGGEKGSGRRRKRELRKHLRDEHGEQS